MMRILIVEDEAALAEGMKFNFEQEGYEVQVAGNGTVAMEIFHSDNFPVDLIVLDLMLPGMSGYEICSEIRKEDANIPILVLSAKRLSEDKTEAFDCGTDQYMTKPFALPELLSRVRNLLDRRQAYQEQMLDNQANQPELTHYQFSNVKVDFLKYQLEIDDQLHPLTVIELELLKYFIQHEDSVLSRAEILENVWGETADITTRSIDNFVMRLRKLVEKDPSQPEHILSVRGIGYRFLASPK